MRAAGAMLLLCAALRIVSLYRPCLSNDEAIYAVAARQMLAGDVLYRDVVDHKPPGIYLPYAATQAIAGSRGGMILLHGILILAVWATGLLLARIVRDRGVATAEIDRRAPLFAALLWIVFTTTLVDVDSLAANCELFMMLPLVASVAVFLGAARASHLVLAGGLVGIATLFKYQAGIQLPLYVVAWFVANRTNKRRALAGASSLAVGAAIPIAAALACLTALGASADARFWFAYNFSYIDSGPVGIAVIGRMLVRGGVIVVAAGLLYALAFRGARAALARGAASDRLALGWAAVSVLAVCVGGRFFGHYFHQLTAPLAVLAAPVAGDFYVRHRRCFVAGLVIPASCFLVLGAMHDRVMTWWGEPDPDYASVVAWLDAHSAPSDAIFVWGNTPVLYFEADRPLGSRFVFADYLTGLVAGEPRPDSDDHIVPGAWDMLEHDFAIRRPKFVIDGSPGNVESFGAFPPERFPRLARALRCEYSVAAQVAGMRIFRRRTVSACANAGP